MESASVASLASVRSCGSRAVLRRRAYRIGTALAVVLALAASGCAEPEEIFWTRKGASDKQFRKVSLACNEQASDAVVKEGSGSCTYNSEGRGTYCTDVDQTDPFQVEQEKRRIKRRLRYLYGQCLEASGWSKNYDGRGFKGRH